MASILNVSVWDAKLFMLKIFECEFYKVIIDAQKEQLNTELEVTWKYPSISNAWIFHYGRLSKSTGYFSLDRIERDFYTLEFYRWMNDAKNKTKEPIAVIYEFTFMCSI